jgi:hypothetical protein
MLYQAGDWAMAAAGLYARRSRVRWLRTFAMNVSQIYERDDKPVKLKIELEKKAAN